MKLVAPIEPLFDSPRKALSFALNHRVHMPRPPMAKLVADETMQRIELADGSRVTVDRRLILRPRDLQLKGMDGVAQAGMVLYHLGRLSDPQQLVLIAQSVPHALPCACRRPCCSGYTPNPPWTHAVLKLCDHLRDEAQLSRMPGKKGLSTSPWLRRALVEKFFLPSRDLTIAWMAQRSGLSEQTVIVHRRPILTFLEKAERQGWRDFDSFLGDAGIVGELK